MGGYSTATETATLCYPSIVCLMSKICVLSHGGFHKCLCSCNHIFPTGSLCNMILPICHDHLNAHTRYRITVPMCWLSKQCFRSMQLWSVCHRYHICRWSVSVWWLLAWHNKRIPLCKSHEEGWGHTLRCSHTAQNEPAMMLCIITSTAIVGI
jgi:hypothetical protein